MRHRPGWHKAAVIVLAVLGVAAAVTFAVRSWPSGTLDAATVLAKSQEAEARILAEATEGKVFHLVDTVYRRHGPAAARIRAMSEDWYLPESYRQELWVEVGRGGKISRARGFVRDDEGSILQEIRTAGDEVVTRDVATGTEERWPLQLSVEDVAHAAKMSVQTIEEEIASGSANIVSHGSVDGSRTIILEVSRQPEIRAAQPESEGEGYSIGYSLPYTADLDAVERVKRTEIDSGTFLPFRWSVVVIDAAGNEYLVEEKERVAFEILERAEVSPGVFSGPPRP